MKFSTFTLQIDPFWNVRADDDEFINFVQIKVATNQKQTSPLSRTSLCMILYEVSTDVCLINGAFVAVSDLYFWWLCL